MKKHGVLAALAGVAMAGTLFAADRTIDADYTLTGDETVDGVLSISEGVTLDLAGHKLTVAGLAGSGTVTSSVVPVYRRLEYLEGNGTPYINTGYTPKSATTADLRLRFTSTPTSGWKSVFGTRKSGANNAWFGVFLNNNGGPYFWRSLRGDQDGITKGNGVVEVGADYYLKLDKDGPSTINGRAFGDGLSGDCAYPALLFAINQDGDNAPWSGVGNGAGQRLYYCRFAESGTIVHDFVPAKRLSDGVLGMYDRTTGDFKTNAGSGAFTAGNVKYDETFADAGELIVEVPLRQPLV